MFFSSLGEAALQLEAEIVIRTSARSTGSPSSFSIDESGETRRTRKLGRLIVSKCFHYIYVILCKTKFWVHNAPLARKRLLWPLDTLYIRGGINPFRYIAAPPSHAKLIESPPDPGDHSLSQGSCWQPDEIKDIKRGRLELFFVILGFVALAVSASSTYLVT
jgi:hypothetical protein